MARLGTSRFRVGPLWLPGALTPDGRFVFAGGRVLDATSGKEVRRVPEELPDGGAVEPARVTADGTAVVLRVTHRDGADARRSVAVWDIATGAVTDRFAFDPEVVPEPSGRPPDRGHVVAAGPGGRSLVVWSATGCCVLWTGLGTASPAPVVLDTHYHPALVDVTPDGRSVVRAGPTVRVWDAATGNLTRTFPGPGDVVVRMAVAPDGRHAVLISGKATPEEQARHETTHRVSLWDLDAGKEVRELTPRLNARRTPALPVLFSPDGTAVLALDDGPWGEPVAVRRWRVADGHAFPVWSLPYAVGAGTPPLPSPDGKTLYLAGYNGVRVYDLATGEDRSHPDLRRGGAYPVGLSADGREVVTADDSPPGQRLRFWDRETGRHLREVPLPDALAGPLYRVPFSPDARLVAVDRGTGPEHERPTAVIETQTGRELYRLRGERYPAFAPDGGRLLTLTPDTKTAFVHDAATGALLRTVPCDWGDDVVFSPDGGVFGQPRGHRFRAFDVATGDPFGGPWDFLDDYFLQRSGAERGGWVREPHDAVGGAALGPGGRRLARVAVRWVGMRPQATRVVAFDTTARKFLWEANPEPADRFWGVYRLPVAFSPDGSFVAVGGRRLIVLLDAETGKEVRRFIGHLGDVSFLRFTPDGTRLVSADHDGTAWVWDAAR